jgi:hypothetical protein
MYEGLQGVLFKYLGDDYVVHIVDFDTADWSRGVSVEEISFFCLNLLKIIRANKECNKSNFWGKFLSATIKDRHLPFI